MNYYKRHLGDYARDTGHLSALEHGIYTLLLDWYYTNERPIPQEKAFRIARGNREETQTVLSEFFELTPDGWKHARADREIAEYKEKADRNREAGKLGGRPKKTQTVNERIPDITLATSHKPLKEQEQAAEITIPLADGTEHPVTASEVSEYRAAYPRIDVMGELRKARAWCFANPAQRKTRRGVGKFVNGWLSRADADKAKTAPQPARQRQVL